MTRLRAFSMILHIDYLTFELTCYDLRNNL